jgi:hypothetical protein
MKLKGEHVLWLIVFVIGTVLTYGVAAMLFEKGDDLEAAALIWWSPFPCPPGIPC